MIITLLTGAFIALLSTAASVSELIEIQLIDKLDETRGFCIDIKGYKERAKVHRELLQARTCYLYQSQLGVDQAFEKGLVQFGKLYMPAFDVCMEAENHNGGASLMLKSCNNTAAQIFDFK